MRILKLVLTVLALWVTPAAAQTAPDGDLEQRMTLAEDYIRLSQGDNIGKTINRYFREAFAEIDAEPEERAWITAQLTTAVEQMLDDYSAEIQDDVAELYTLEELEALVAFHQTPLGRSIANKNVEASIAMQEALGPLMMDALEGVAAKYCARYGCEETSTPGKSAR